MRRKVSFHEVLKIAAFIPTYREGVGQGLTLVFRDGSSGWMEQGLRSFINQLARYFTINLQEARRKFGQLLGQVNLTPLALSPFLIFVPLKVCSPRVSGDPAYGYFRLRSIIKIRQEPKPCTLEIEGGHLVTTNQSLRTVRRRLRAARRLEQFLLDEYSKTVDDKRHLFLLETGWTANFLQDNASAQGSKSSDDKDESVKMHNLMEDLVRIGVDEVLAAGKETMCTCRQCHLEMVAFALNQLPPRYIVSGFMKSELKEYTACSQLYSDVAAAVTKAVSSLQKKIRHE